MWGKVDDSSKTEREMDGYLLLCYTLNQSSCTLPTPKQYAQNDYSHETRFLLSYICSLTKY